VTPKELAWNACMHVQTFKQPCPTLSVCHCFRHFTGDDQLDRHQLASHRIILVARDSEHAKHGFRLPFFFVLLSTEIGRINAPRNGNINALATPCRC